MHTDLLDSVISRISMQHQQSLTHPAFSISSAFEPPYLQINGHVGLEATYFNQMTQQFEPFIEPWKMQASISQTVKNDMFDIKIFSKDLLNLNITYGMALSIRNTY